MKSSIVIAVAFAVLVASSAHAGSSICRLDDINGDGIADVAVANRDTGADERVWWLSGKDGTLLHTWSGSLPGDGFAVSVVRLEPDHRDGAAELGVLVSGNLSKPSDRQRIVLMSPRSGAIRREIELTPRIPWRSPSAATVGDWNGDKLPDLAVGLPNWSESCRSRVCVLSGSDGAVLFEHTSETRGSASDDQLGTALVCIGDIDGDGRADLVVGAPLRKSSDGMLRRRPTIVPPQTRDRELDVVLPDDVGCVLLVSGGSGQPLAVSWGDRPDDQFGTTIAVVGDVDGDGRSEIAVAAPSRYVRILSYDPEKHELRVQRTIGSHGGYVIMDEFGSTLDAAGDVDGDGKPDLVIAANEPGPGDLFDEGYAEVWSCATGKRIALLISSPSEGVDACSLGDVSGDGVSDVALSVMTVRTKRSESPSQFVRVVSARDGKKNLWERSVAELRAGTPVKR